MMLFVMLVNGLRGRPMLETFLFPVGLTPQPR
jgi:hypothetical protein